MKKKWSAVFLLFCLIALAACDSDVINSDPNLRKEKIPNSKELTLKDSLRILKFKNFDFGILTDPKDVLIKDLYAISNASETDTITIYSVDFKNPDEMFNYFFPSQNEGQDYLPITLKPGDLYEVIVAFNWHSVPVTPAPGIYRDTIFFNHSKNLFITVVGEAL